jgi:hypothetical protein
VLLLGAMSAAQQPPAAPAKPDTPEITAMIEQARKAACANDNHRLAYPL